MRNAGRVFRNAMLGMEKPAGTARRAGFFYVRRCALRNTQLSAMLATRLPTERAMPRTRPSELSPLIPGKRRARPAPPPELNAREAEIWTDITGRLPADWFKASGPLLKELCRHIRLGDRLSEDIARAQAALDELRQRAEPPTKLLAEATKEYRALLRMHGLQSTRVGTLSTALRLTPQSRYRADAAKVRASEATSYPEPWNDWPGGRDESSSDRDFDEPGDPKTKQ
jgi:hypothetical protein